MESSSKAAIPKKSLYLFYEHYPEVQKCFYSLCRIDIDSTALSLDLNSTATNLSPILKIVMGGRNSWGTSLSKAERVFEETMRKCERIWDNVAMGVNEVTWKNKVTGMKCELLGSNLYFLGGTEEDVEGHVELRRDVYVMDLLTNNFKRMDARLNSGKPEPSVTFTANGKLYIIGSIPDVSSEQLSGMNLFEYFDPTTGQWKVIDKLPEVGMERIGFNLRLVHKGIHWDGCTMLSKHQGEEVALVGSEYPGFGGEQGHTVKFVYNIKSGMWSPRIPSNPIITGYIEGRESNFLYGICILGPPYKLEFGLLDKMTCYNCEAHGNRLAHMTNCGTTSTNMVEGRKKWAEWVSYFTSPYADCTNVLLRYLGKGYFCHVTCGMVYRPNTFNDEVIADRYTRGIRITLFKEENQGAGAGAGVCFDCRVLGSKKYEITTPNVFNRAELIRCFVVPSQKILHRRKNKKQKGKGRTSAV